MIHNMTRALIRSTAIRKARAHEPYGAVVVDKLVPSSRRRPAICASVWRAGVCSSGRRVIAATSHKEVSQHRTYALTPRACELDHVFVVGSPDRSPHQDAEP